MLKYSNNEVAKSFVRFENAKRMLPTTATAEEIMQRAEEKDIVDFVEKVMLRHDFIATITEETDLPHYAEKMARKIYDKLPEELLPHIVEWCKGEPFSDIDYHGLTINQILTWKPQNILYKADAFIILQKWEGLGYPPVKEFLDEWFREA